MTHPPQDGTPRDPGTPLDPTARHAATSDTATFPRTSADPDVQITQRSHPTEVGLAGTPRTGHPVTDYDVLDDPEPRVERPGLDGRTVDRSGRLPAASWKFVLRTAYAGFFRDHCIDLAAGLSFRMLLSLAPALVSLVSILSLAGQSGTIVNDVMDELERIVPSQTWSTIRPLLDSVLDTPSPGLGLFVGLAVALWSSSGYVKSFGRAMNRVVGIEEGRGPIVFNVVMYLLTLGMLILGALALLVFVLSGPVASAIGGVLGMSDVSLAVWNVARWFLLAGIVVLCVAVLYHATPNLKQPRFRWLSIGALIAIVVSILATFGFTFYVSQFGAFNATYGALTGVIIFLVWVFIVNGILLFGAELDCEIERARELRAGLPAEVALQLPVRSTKLTQKQARQAEEEVRRAANLRATAGTSQKDPGDAARKDGQRSTGTQPKH